MAKILGALVLGAALAVGVMLALGYDRTLADSFAQNAVTVSHILHAVHDTDQAMRAAG